MNHRWIAAVAVLTAGPVLAAENASGPIQIVSAEFGPSGARKVVDYRARLQTYCGAQATACETFCDPSTTGARKPLSLPFTAAPVCRVTYRCGATMTKTAETEWKDELVLNCRERS